MDTETFVDTSNVERVPTIPIYLRVRPVNKSDNKFLSILNDEEIEIVPSIHMKDNSELKVERYRFTSVFRETSTQHDVYTKVLHPYVDKMFNNPENKSSLVIAYGTSGSGKTYTTIGNSNLPGLLYLMLQDVLKIIGNNHTRISINPVRWNEVEFDENSFARSFDIFATNDEPSEKSHEYALFISLFEIYLDQVIDLQSNDFPTDRKYNYSINDFKYKRPFLQIREDLQHRKYVSSLTHLRIYNMDNAHDAIEKAMSNRKAIETNINYSSSRSHLVSTVMLVKIPRNKNIKVEDLQVTQISVVDLAGAERATQSKVDDIAQKESGNINRSLHSFKMCLDALNENQKKLTKKPVVIPWRVSKLTLLLQPYFEYGNVSFLVNVNPSSCYSAVAGEVFRFARKAGALLQFRNVILSEYPSLSTQINNSKFTTTTVTGLRKSELIGPKNKSSLVSENGKKPHQDLIALADSIDDYKKTIQEYESRLNFIGKSNNNSDTTNLAQLEGYVLRNINDKRIAGGETYSLIGTRCKKNISADIDSKFPKGINSYNGNELLIEDSRNKELYAKTVDYLCEQIKNDFTNNDHNESAYMVDYFKQKLFPVLYSIGFKIIEKDEVPINYTNKNTQNLEIKSKLIKSQSCIVANDNLNHDDLLDELNKKSIEINGLNTKINTVTANLDDKLKLLSSVETELENVKRMYELEKLKSEQNMIDIEEYKNNIIQLKETMLFKDKEIKIQKQKIKLEEKQSEEYAKNLEKCQNEIDELNCNANTFKEEADALKIKCETLNSEVIALKTVNNSSNSEVGTLNAVFENEMVNGNLLIDVDIERKFESVYNELILNKSQNKILQELTDSQGDNIKQLTFKVEQLVSDNQKLQDLMVEEDKKSKRLCDDVEQLNSNLRKVKEELVVSNAKSERLQYEADYESIENKHLIELIKKKDELICVLKSQSDIFDRISKSSEIKKSKIKNSNILTAPKYCGKTPERVNEDENNISPYKFISPINKRVSLNKDANENTSQLQKLKEEISEFKYKNIEKSLTLKESLINIQDYNRREFEALCVIKSIFPDLEDIKTLQEFISVGREYTTVNKYFNCNKYLDSNFSRKIIRRSDIIKPSYNTSLNHNTEKRRRSEYPAILKGLELNENMISLSSDPFSYVKDIDDCQIINEIVNQINNLSEKLKKMEKVITEYALADREKNKMLDIYEKCESKLKKEVITYRDMCKFMETKIQSLEHELTEKTSESIGVKILSMEVYEKLKLYIVNVENCYINQLSDIKYLLCSNQYHVSTSDVLDTIMMSFTEQLENKYNKDLTNKPLVDDYVKKVDITVYSQRLMSLANFLMKGFKYIEGIKEIISTESECNDYKSNDIDKSINIFKSKWDQNEKSVREGIKNFSKTFACQIYATLDQLILNQNYSLETLFSKIKNLESVIDGLNNYTIDRSNNKSLILSHELDHNNNQVAKKNDYTTFNTQITKILTSETISTSMDFHNNMDHNPEIINTTKSNKIIQLDIPYLVSTLSKNLEKIRNSLTNLINHSNNNEHILEKDFDSIVLATSSLKSFIESESSKPLSEYVNPNTFSQPVLSLWSLIIVPLADKILELKKKNAETDRFTQFAPMSSNVGRVSNVTEFFVSPKRPILAYASPVKSSTVEVYDVDDDELVETPAIFDFSRRPSNTATRISKGNNSRASFRESPKIENVSDVALNPISPNVKNKMEEIFVPEKEKFRIDGAAWDAAIKSEIKSTSGMAHTELSSIQVLKRMRKLGKRKALDMDTMDDEVDDIDIDDDYKGKRYSSIAKKLEENVL